MYGFVCDMDGVLYRGAKAVPGAKQFVDALQKSGRSYLFLTNNPDYTPRQLRLRLRRLGMHVPEKHFYTSALATATFLTSEMRRPRAYVIGDDALLEALDEAGVERVERHPDYVVVGTTRRFNYARAEKAINFALAGSRLIGTNPDALGPTEKGFAPGCGALMAMIEKAANRRAYFIGKPNPLMMRIAVRRMNMHTSQAYMVGDRMDTDIAVGMEAGMQTILVLSGVTKRADLPLFPYKPNWIYPTVGQIPLEELP